MRCTQAPTLAFSYSFFPICFWPSPLRSRGKQTTHPASTRVIRPTPRRVRLGFLCCIVAAPFRSCWRSIVSSFNGAVTAVPDIHKAQNSPVLDAVKQMPVRVNSHRENPKREPNVLSSILPSVQSRVERSRGSRCMTHKTARPSADRVSSAPRWRQHRVDHKQRCATGERNKPPTSLSPAVSAVDRSIAAGGEFLGQPSACGVASVEKARLA